MALNRRCFLRTLPLLAAPAALTGCLTPIVRRTKIYKEYIAADVLDKTVSYDGKLEWIGEGADAIPVLYLKGSDYERGFQHGRLLKPQIQKNLQRVLKITYGLVGKKIPLVGKRVTHRLAMDAWDVMEKHVPEEYKDELQGIADGADVSLHSLQWVHALPEITETISCSAIASWGTATADGELYQVRVLDYGAVSGIQEFAAMFVHKPNKGLPYLNIGWAGFTGVVSGMNSEGVAVSEMGYARPGKELPGIPHPQPPETLDGMPMVFLLKEVLQYSSSAQQASAFIQRAPGNDYYVFLVGDGKTPSGKPEVLGFIKTRDFCRVYDMNDTSLPVPALKDIFYGSHTMDLCYNLTKEQLGKLTPEVYMKQIIPKVARPSNLHNVVYENKNLRAWISNAEGKQIASERPYVLFDFGKALEKF